MEFLLKIKGILDGDDFFFVYVLYWYDGIILMIKKWNWYWNIDVIGVLCGKYWMLVLGLWFGEMVI